MDINLRECIMVFMIGEYSCSQSSCISADVLYHSFLISRSPPFGMLLISHDLFLLIADVSLFWHQSSLLLRYKVTSMYIHVNAGGSCVSDSPLLHGRLHSTYCCHRHINSCWILSFHVSVLHLCGPCSLFLAADASLFRSYVIPCSPVFTIELRYQWCSLCMFSFFVPPLPHIISHSCWGCSL